MPLRAPRWRLPRLQWRSLTRVFYVDVAVKDLTTWDAIDFNCPEPLRRRGSLVRPTKPQPEPARPELDLPVASSPCGSSAGGGDHSDIDYFEDSIYASRGLMLKPRRRASLFTKSPPRKRKVPRETRAKRSKRSKRVLSMLVGKPREREHLPATSDVSSEAGSVRREFSLASRAFGVRRTTASSDPSPVRDRKDGGVNAGPGPTRIRRTVSTSSIQTSESAALPFFRNFAR